MLQVRIYKSGAVLMTHFEHNGIKYQAAQDWIGTSIAESSNPFHPVYMKYRHSRERSHDDMVTSISEFTGTDVSEIK